MKLPDNESFDRIYKLTVLSSILILALYFGGNIIFPILLALFFSFALLGPARWLEKIGLPRFLSALFLVATSAVAIGALLGFISFEGYKLVHEIDTKTSSESLGFIKEIGSEIDKRTDLKLPAKDDAITMLSKKLVNSSGAALKTGLNMIQTTFLYLSLVPLYAALFLSFRGRIRVFFNEFYKKKNFNKGVHILEEIAKMIQSYLSGLFVVVVIVGVLYAAGLYFIGVKFALLLALVSAVLIVVPYIGALIGAILPMTVALLTMDEWWYSLVVLGLFVVIQLLEGYVLTPFIVGKNVDLNPLVIIIGMIVLGTVGGIMGIVLAVPIIASVKIVLKHSSDLYPLAGLMNQENN